MALTSASISRDQAYRYDLTRRWSEGPHALWIMLNPSTADATVDDPTIRRCVAFSKREGCGALAVVNLFALRSSDPKRLILAPDPVGPQNELYLRGWLGRSDVKLVIAAWGNLPGPGPRLRSLRPQVRLLAGEYGHTLQCFGRTLRGEPRHPLYIKGDASLEVLP